MQANRATVDYILDSKTSEVPITHVLFLRRELTILQLLRGCQIKFCKNKIEKPDLNYIIIFCKKRTTIMLLYIT